MKLAYIGPFDDVEVVTRDVSFVARKGEPIDVADEIAGTAPSGDDPGSGLLAQVDNWKPASKTRGTED